MFNKSCHTFKTASSCGILTREVKRIVGLAVSAPISRYKEKRRKKKSDRIASLPVPAVIPDADARVQALGKRRLFFSGSASRTVRGIKKGDVVWSALTDLKPFEGLDGAFMPDTFILIPRKAVETTFANCMDLTDSFEALNRIMEVNSGKKIRGTRRAPMFDKPEDDGSYVTFGTAAARNKKGLIESTRNLSEMPEDRALLDRLIRKVEHVALQFIDSRSIVAIDCINKVTGRKGIPLSDSKYSKVWSAVAMSKNCFLPSHVDDDYFMTALFVLCREKIDNSNEVRVRFCFAREGVSVGLRNGDVLIFNPQKEHCMSSRIQIDQDVMVLALYLKTAVVGLNDAKRDLTFLQKYD